MCQWYTSAFALWILAEMTWRKSWIWLPNKGFKKNVIFLFEIQIIFYRSWDKKNFCTASRLFWPEARFEGFFGLREAVRPLEGQKIPRNGPKAKRVWTKCKTCFCPWSYKIWSVLSVKCNFFILGISLLREKDKFPHKKNSLGLKNFLSLLPENDKIAPGKKTKPLYKKKAFN